MLPGILKRGLSRQTVPAGRFAGFGGRGSTSMKTPVLARQIASASAVVRTRAPAKRVRNRRPIIFGAIPVGLGHEFFARVRAPTSAIDASINTGRVSDHGDFVAVSAVIG